MKRKVLDVVFLLVFCTVLTMTSNMKTVETINVVDELPVCVETDRSFTTESKEVNLITPVCYSSSQNQEIQTVENMTNQINTYSNRWNIFLTQEEVDLLARIVWVESCGEPADGQEAVVEVIFNRMKSDMYPDTLYEVLSQDNPVQFCSWRLRDGARPTDKEYASIYNVLYGNTNILRNDTIYFSTFNLTSNIDVRLGNHIFCGP